MGRTISLTLYARILSVHYCIFNTNLTVRECHEKNEIPISSNSRWLIPTPILIPSSLAQWFPSTWDSMGPMGIPIWFSPLLAVITLNWYPGKASVFKDCSKVAEVLLLRIHARRVNGYLSAWKIKSKIGSWRRGILIRGFWFRNIFKQKSAVEKRKKNEKDGKRSKESES